MHDPDPAARGTSGSAGSRTGPRPRPGAGPRRSALGPSAAGRREDPQVAGDDEGEDREGAPEEREDQGIGGHLGERLEHLGVHLSSASARPSAGPSPASRDRTGRRASRGRGQGPGTIASSDSPAPPGLPGTFTTRVRPRTPTRPRDRSAIGVERRPSARMSLGQPRDLVVEDGRGRLGRDVARGQSGAAGRHHERRRVARHRRRPPRSRSTSSGTTARSTAKPSSVSGSASRSPEASSRTPAADPVADRDHGRSSPVAGSGVSGRHPRSSSVRRSGRPSGRRACGPTCAGTVAPLAVRRDRTQSPLLPPVFETRRIERISTPRSTPLTIS